MRVLLELCKSMNCCEIRGQGYYYEALKKRKKERLNGEVKSQPSTEGWLLQPDCNGFLHTSFAPSVSSSQSGNRDAF